MTGIQCDATNACMQWPGPVVAAPPRPLLACVIYVPLRSEPFLPCPFQQHVAQCEILPRGDSTGKGSAIDLNVLQSTKP